MVLKDKEGKLQRETKADLEIMRNYIKEHFTRIREEWEIKCLPNEIWTNQESETHILEEKNHFMQQHNNSAVQKYANANGKRRQKIDGMGNEIRLNEIKKTIQKISNRKAVGKD